MRSIITVILLTAFFSGQAFSYEGPAWVGLHAEADKKNLAEASLHLRQHESDFDASYIIGLIYLDLHRNEEAEKIFLRMHRLFPDKLEVNWGLAEVLRRRHALNGAQAALEKIIKQDPEFAPAYISLAYIKYIKLDFKECRVLALRVIRMGRNRVDLSNYVRAYLLAGGAGGMIAHYGGPLSKAVYGGGVFANLKKAEQLKPGSAGVLFGLGSFYLLAPTVAGGNKAKAEVYLEKAIKADPLFADAYVRLAQLYLIRGDKPRYLEYLDKALEIDPGCELARDIKNGECNYICLGRDSGDLL